MAEHRVLARPRRAAVPGRRSGVRHGAGGHTVVQSRLGGGARRKRCARALTRCLLADAQQPVFRRGPREDRRDGRSRCTDSAVAARVVWAGYNQFCRRAYTKLPATIATMRAMTIGKVPLQFSVGMPGKFMP